MRNRSAFLRRASFHAAVREPRKHAASVCYDDALLQRRRKGSGDPPVLQSRRFGPSRVEWWVRLPHASATTSISVRLRGHSVRAVSRRTVTQRWLSFRHLLVGGFTRRLLGSTKPLLLSDMYVTQPQGLTP